MKCLLLASAMLLMSSFAASAEDLNSKQLQLRSDIKNYIAQEGFVPEIDSDGDIHFKKEGTNYYVSVYSYDESPMYVVMFVPFDYPEEYSKKTCITACNELNKYKAVKSVCYENTYQIRVECFVEKASSFTDSFYKYLSQMQAVREDFMEECSKVQNSRQGGAGI